MKNILKIFMSSLLVAILAGCGGGDSGGGGGVVGASGATGSASGAGAASGAAGSFLAQVSSIVAGLTSNTATPVAVDSITAATDPLAGPSPVN